MQLSSLTIPRSYSRFPLTSHHITVLKKRYMQHFKQLPWQQATQVPAQSASTTHFCWAEFNTPQSPPSHSKLQPTKLFLP